ncbi:protein adenylyltransferase FICD-like [Lineus longissimus]|uniref:protein adenylyltransferase FICD-like n=1 Tax=Lineus longissimus TaxID=88925 RepID=UPI002B4C3B28
MGLVKCRDDSQENQSNDDKMSEISTQKMTTVITCGIVFLTGVSLALLVMWIPSFRVFLNLIDRGKTFSGLSPPPSGFGRITDGHDHPSLSLKKKAAVSADLKNEALASLHLALEMKAKGKIEKATKLFQHAYSLDPKHADVLVEYGKHIEDESEDIIFAEHLYTKALVVNPDHTRAITMKARISPMVKDIDKTTLDRIDNKRDELYKIPDAHPGLRRIKQEAYFQHIYHTTAIEGNTMTYLQARHVIETRMAIGGKSVLEHNELLGLDAALRYVNSTLLRRIGMISLTDILEIHRRVLGYVDPHEAGRLRKTQVFVADHRPPHAKDVPALMFEFVEWLNSYEALNLHPIEYAALAHYKFVVIHPFYDGNGRTARLLMNLILMQAGFPPVTIKVEQKHEYFQHIVTGNEGDIRPFIRFIARCTEIALDEFLMCSLESHDLVLADDHRHSQPTENGRTIIIEP